MASDASREQRMQHRVRRALHYGWPVLGLLALLWFPFDWLSVVWPPFGALFRVVFRTAHDHFIGHTVFFFVVGFLVLALLPRLRRRPDWYLLGLALAALVQEAIQALFRGQAPTFTDTNAFAGDALGGIGALALWWAIGAALYGRSRKRSRR